MDLMASGSGWELALVTAQSNNTSHVVESKLVWTYLALFDLTPLPWDLVFLTLEEVLTF